MCHHPAHVTESEQAEALPEYESNFYDLLHLMNFKEAFMQEYRFRTIEIAQNELSGQAKKCRTCSLVKGLADYYVSSRDGI